MRNDAQRAVAFGVEDETLGGPLAHLAGGDRAERGTAMAAAVQAVAGTAVAGIVAAGAAADRPNAAHWVRVKNRLRGELGEDVYTSWFARLEFDRADGAVIYLSVPTKFLRQWIQGHYADRLLELWAAERGDVRRVEVTVRSAARPKVAAEPVRREDLPAAAGREVPTLLPGLRAVPPSAMPRLPAASGPFGGTPLDPRLTFATFCEGAANRMAFAAARSVAEAGADRPVQFNPLFLHAGVGRGKTHLLQAIANASAAAAPGRKIVYLTAEHFMFRFVAALRSQSAIPFKESIREIDLILIDDIQFLQGKQVQAEFGHTLNVLIDGARQVAVAADRPPAELETLDERLRSRLGGGIAIEIGNLDATLRRSILGTRFGAAASLYPGIAIPEEVLDYVAERVTSNARDLEGALNRLVAQWQFTAAPVTLASAEVTLRDLIGIREPRRVRIEDIQRAVSRHFNVSKADLLSARRTRTIVRPRQIAMYLAKLLTPRSLPEIGRRFGDRDHTTVLHAVRKVEELMLADRALAEEVEMLKRLIDE